MKKGGLISVIVLLMAGGVCFARTITVDDDGPADFDRVKDAVNDANDGDVVIVAPGTYIECQINFDGKAITVRSTDPCDANIVASTKVGFWSPCGYEFNRGIFRFENNEDSNSVLAGFTINNYRFCGSSIYCESSSPTISNCNITSGGIYGEYSGSPTITGCTITGNAGISFYYPDGNPEIINCTVSDAFGISFTGDSLILTDSVIRGNSSPAAGGGVYVYAFELIISNCEISDNQATSGGGISLAGYYHGNDAVKIAGCVITGNSANRGGAIEISDSDFQNWECSSVNIDNCTISGNSARCGGAFAIYSNWFAPESPSIVVTNCNISGNAAEVLGGGFYYTYNQVGISKISNSVINGNSAKEGGGIYCYQGGLATSSCTISGNSAKEGGGIHCEIRDMTVSNCILFGNTASDGAEIMLQDNLSFNSYLAVSYSDIKGGKEGIYVGPGAELEWGPGNIDADPCFVMAGYWDVNDTWVDGDYHLLAKSPCIDTGDPNYISEPNETDLDGNERVVDGRIDMGAYEYIPPVEVEVKLTPQMLNCDSKGRWVKAHIILPEGFYAEDVDVNTPAAAEPVGVESEFIEVNEYGNGHFDVQIYFEREGFCEALSDTEGGLLEVTVTGSLTDGRKFEGSDTIRLKSKLRQNRHRQNKKLFEGRRK